MSEFVLEEATVAVDVPLPVDVTESTIVSLVQHVLEMESASGSWVLGFQFVSDPVMQRLHVQFMGLDSPTDIMTFPYETNDWGGLVGASEAGGDIVISVDRATEQAGEGNWSVSNELLFLIAHGMLHLLGWDDGTDIERTAMLSRQRSLLETFQR